MGTFYTVGFGPLTLGSLPGGQSGGSRSTSGYPCLLVFTWYCSEMRSKPIPRWDVHFGEIDDDRKDSTGPHITFRPQLGGHR